MGWNWEHIARFIRSVVALDRPGMGSSITSATAFQTSAVSSAPAPSSAVRMSSSWACTFSRNSSHSRSRSVRIWLPPIQCRKLFPILLPAVERPLALLPRSCTDCVNSSYISRSVSAHCTSSACSRMVSAPFNFNIFVHNDIIRVVESLVNATFPAKPQETRHYFSPFCTI